MNWKYYQIIDKNQVGRILDIGNAQIYVDGVWIDDSDFVLRDRWVGYEPGEKGLGQSDMLFRLKEISEGEAMELIG